MEVMTGPLLDEIVTPGDVADAVLAPVPVTLSVQAVPDAEGVVNVALQTPPEAEKPETVEAPEQPPPHVAPVRPDGAATT
jgi:hypothetical protein